MFFSKTGWNLRFVRYSDRSQYTQNTDPFYIDPLPIWRSLGALFHDFPEYNYENTVVVSNFANTLEDDKMNDLILPQYHPKISKTDFFDDKHMRYLEHYVLGLFAMDKFVGTDVW